MAETKQATTPKNKGGRQTRLTPAIFDAIVRAVGGGLPLAYVPGLIGVPGSTFRAWIREGRKATAGRCHALVSAVNAAEANMVERCLATIKTAAETDWRAQRWLLERYDPQQFGNPKVMETEIRDTLNLLKATRRREEKESRKRHAELQQRMQYMAQPQPQRDPPVPPGGFSWPRNPFDPSCELWVNCPGGQRRRARVQGDGQTVVLGETEAEYAAWLASREERQSRIERSDEAPPAADTNPAPADPLFDQADDPFR